MTYCHSSAFGCQCNSRNAPGAKSRITPVTVVEIGNRVESTRHSRPPLNTAYGATASIRNLCVSGGETRGPCKLSGISSGGIVPRAKYTSSLGNSLNDDSGRLKFFASSAFGACPIQSVILNVPNSEK